MTKRSVVYQAIDSEREYQKFWEGSESKGLHSLTEWFAFIQDYTSEALHECSRKPSQVIAESGPKMLRKIAAMAVAGMEEHGAPFRDLSDLETAKERHGFKQK